jgi:4-amino-4-deoxychorismate lyase
MSATPDLLLVNGREVDPSGRDSVSALDRGFHFGDGLFETIAGVRGKPRFLSLHLDRLASGCERLHIDVGDIGLIRKEIETASAATDVSLIKVMVTRGPAVARGYAWSGRETATRVLLRYAWPQEDMATQREGVAVRISAMRLGENPALAGMKHLNRLEQVIARSEVPSAEAAELLLFSGAGHLVCGTMSNVFVERAGRLITPCVDRCGVAGVMRRVVMREAAKAGIAVEEGMVSEADLDATREIFLTNARIGIWPVRSVGSRVLGVGALTQRAQSSIAPLLENPVDA